MRRRIIAILGLAAILLPTIASAQGILIDIDPNHRYRLPRPIIIHPRPPRPRPLPPTSYKIKELGMNVSLKGQVARVQVTQSFVNTGSRTMEVCFVFPLPYDGAVDRMTFLVDGKEYSAKLLGAKEARRIYEGYVRRNQDPALLEWMGTGMFKTSVFPVPPGKERRVTLRYSQVCRKSGGLTEFLFPLSTAKFTSHAVEKVRFQMSLESNEPIKNIYSPSHSVKIKRRGDKYANISYEVKNRVPTTDFRLLYDIGDKAVGASVISYKPDDGEDGYFLMLATPSVRKANDKPMKKNIVFVVDRSGSMSGKKIEQAKASLKFVLNNLRKGDLFNVIAYDSVVESFKPELQRFNDETREAALAFVDSIYAGGSTNIDGALKSALSLLKDSKRPSFVMFLTDGLPTAGETNENRIVLNAKSRNGVRARIFSMGVGYDVNSRLLDKLARSGYGQSEYVRPNEDIEEHVSRLYNRIGAPALTNVKIKFDVEGARQPVNRVYPREIYDLFAGDQLVLVGRYKKSGTARVTVTGRIGDDRETLHFPAKFVSISGDESNAFVEKLWAIRRVGEIIDEIDLNGKNQELVNELVRISTKHGIITPYTAFLADENTRIRDFTLNRRRANGALDALNAAEGQAGFSQRLAKQRYQRAANLSDLDEAKNLEATRSSLGGGGVAGRGLPAGKKAQAGALPGRAGLPAANAKADRVAIRNVQSLGRKTFYYRKGRWVDSVLTEAQEKKVIKIKRYSKEYFALILKHGKDAAKYLALEGDVTVVLGGQAYSF